MVLADDDVDALCLVPGVGKKTAARLLVELKSRLDAWPSSTRPRSPPAATRRHVGADRPVLADVREALADLGYGPDEVRGGAARAARAERRRRRRCSSEALQHLAVAPMTRACADA